MTNIESALIGKNTHFIIEGTTLDGRAFRPSDWAERMCDSLSEFKGRRVCYSSLLRPITYRGNRSVMVDKALKNQHPSLFEEILYFAHSNNLKITENIDPIL